MTDPFAKLAELGLKLPAVVPPAAAYVPAVQSGIHVYVSGQLPMVDGKLPRTGKVGGDVTPEDAKELAGRCALNALAAVHSLVGLDKVVRIVKVQGFVASAEGFTGQPGVINGRPSSSSASSARRAGTRAAPSASPSCRWVRRLRSM